MLCCSCLCCSKGKNNTAFKALFAISKGFATAQAALNLQLAISNAMASGPFPWNMAAMAQVAAAGGSLISSIASVGYPTLAMLDISEPPAAATWAIAAIFHGNGPDAIALEIAS